MIRWRTTIVCAAVCAAMVLVGGCEEAVTDNSGSGSGRPADPPPAQHPSGPTRDEFASGEPWKAYLRDGTVDPLTQRAVDALRAAVPAAEWDEFVSDLETLTVDSTFSEFVTTQAFRTVLRVAAPIYDAHFVGTSSLSRRLQVQSSGDTDQETLTQLGVEFTRVMIGLGLGVGTTVWGCLAVTPVICAGSVLAGYLLYSLYWDTAEAAGLPPGTGGGHATGLVELADRIVPETAPDGGTVGTTTTVPDDIEYQGETLNTEIGVVTLSTDRQPGDQVTIDVSVRDHACEDGDRVSIQVLRDSTWETVFTGEIFNPWQRTSFSATVGYHYTVVAIALNGTGFKGNCDHVDLNSGEMSVSYDGRGETTSWLAPGGSGSAGVINVRP